MLESHFNKVAGLKVSNFIKKDSYIGVFLELCGIFKNNFFYRTPLVTASVMELLFAKS